MLMGFFGYGLHFCKRFHELKNSIFVHLSPSEIVGGVLFGLLLSGG